MGTPGSLSCGEAGQAVAAGISSRQHQEVQNALLHSMVQCLLVASSGWCAGGQVYPSSTRDLGDTTNSEAVMLLEILPQISLTG